MPAARLHRALSDESRVRILEILHEAEAPLDAQELAQRVGLHVNTVRAHLDVLIEVGLASTRLEERSRPGRPRMLYRANPGAPHEGEPTGYRLLAQVLASYLAETQPDPGACAEQAGRVWGGYLVERAAPFTSISTQETVQRVVRLLDRFGFRPELRSDKKGHEILMKRCPFHDAAKVYPGVVCQVHLGLIRGSLEELGGTVEADGLQAFVEPGVCVARLTV